jgi:hypothetical protein
MRSLRVDVVRVLDLHVQLLQSNGSARSLPLFFLKINYAENEILVYRIFI